MENESTPEIRNLPAQPARVETGPLQFGDDWPGVFIRGDQAAAFAFDLNALVENTIESGAVPMEIVPLISAYNVLRSCVVGPAREMLPDLPFPDASLEVKPLPIPPTLLGEMREIANGELPDGDGVTVPVALWAEEWIKKLGNANGCRWSEDADGNWHTGCGQAFVLNEGTPVENGIRYCHSCGRPVEQQLHAGDAIRGEHAKRHH